MGLETAATIAGIGAASASTAGGVATLFSDAPGGGGRLKLPPELEAELLGNVSKFTGQIEKDLNATEKLIPLIENRLDLIDSQLAQAQIDPAVIKRLNQIEANIAAEFGQQVAADVKAGIISERAKNQAIALQDQIEQELASQGNQIDDQLRSEIQQSIRNRLAGSSRENQILQGIQDEVLKEIKLQGTAGTEADPATERQIKDEETKLRNSLRNSLGPDYENTSQGRRALSDFRQSATEVRFDSRDRRIASLGSLTGTAVGSIEASDTGIARSIANVEGSQQLGVNRLNRISQLGQTITAPVQAAIAAGEPERLRRAENLQRGQVTSGIIQGMRTQFGQGQQLRAGIAESRAEIPSRLRDRILRNRAAGIDLFQKLGQFDFSSETQDALLTGNAPGFKGRDEIYGGAFDIGSDGGGSGGGALNPNSSEVRNIQQFIHSEFSQSGNKNVVRESALKKLNPRQLQIARRLKLIEGL